MGTFVMSDIILAAAHLADRSGAKDFEIGFDRDDVPANEAGWHAQVSYQGARLIVSNEPTPTLAALALCQRLLYNADCRCGRKVTTDDEDGCRWRLMGSAWVPGCDEPPVRYEGQRGDVTAMRTALDNRAQRRAAGRAKGRKR